MALSDKVSVDRMYDVIFEAAREMHAKLDPFLKETARLLFGIANTWEKNPREHEEMLALAFDVAVVYGVLGATEKEKV